MDENVADFPFTSGFVTLELGFVGSTVTGVTVTGSSNALNFTTVASLAKLTIGFAAFSVPGVSKITLVSSLDDGLGSLGCTAGMIVDT